MEVLDEEASSLQAMSSAPLLGRTVCASCNEEIVDKYLLKVNPVILYFYFIYFACIVFPAYLTLEYVFFSPLLFGSKLLFFPLLSSFIHRVTFAKSSYFCFRLTTCAGMCAVSPAACARLHLAATQVATSKKKRFSANWITFGEYIALLKMLISADSTIT